MPWNGTGQYVLPPAYTPEVNGTVIDATRYNGTTSDIASGISFALARNGENIPTANLPMGGYRHTNVGAAVLPDQYATLAQVQAMAYTAANISYTAPYTSAVALTQQLFNSAIVTPEQFGATGGNAVVDTPAWIAALATGKSVQGFPGRNYLLNSPLTVTTDGQEIFGNFTFTATGSFDVLTFNGSENAKLNGPVFDLSGMTGGRAFVVNNSDRTFISNVIVLSPFNFLYTSRFNVLALTNVWVNGCRGTIGVHLFGTVALRSDVAVFNNVTISADGTVAHVNRITGLKWEGNVHTVASNGLRFVVPAKGVEILPSDGTTDNDRPAFGFFDDLEIDYPYGIGFDASYGYAIYANNYYIANSVTEAGVSIGANARVGTWGGGFLRGNKKEGVVVAGQDWNFLGAHVAFNSLGAGGSYDGVRCAGTAERVNFAGVHSGQEEGSGAVQRYGLQIDAGATGVTWSGGTLSGNLLAPWRDQSAGPNDNVFIDAGGTGYGLTHNIMWGTSQGIGGAFSCTVTAGAITAAAVTAAGIHYTTAPSVFAYDPAGTGSGATFTATVNTSGGLSGITINTAGAGYSAGTMLFIQPSAGEPTLRPTGSGTNISARFWAKGTTGQALLGNDYGDGFGAIGVASGVNKLVAKGAATGSDPALFADGSDATIHIRMIPKNPAAGATSVLEGLATHDYANDIAAAAAGIPIDGFYHTSGTVKVRRT